MKNNPVKNDIVQGDVIKPYISNDFKEIKKSFNMSLTPLTRSSEQTYEAITRVVSNKNTSFLYKCLLDSNFVVKVIDKLEFPITLCKKCKYKGVEDGKIFVYKNEKCVVGTTFVHKNTQQCITRICLFKLNDSINTFKIIEPEFDQTFNQKNWSPFEYNGELLGVYSFEPHIIIKIDLETNTANKIYSNDVVPKKHVSYKDSWRVGIPPLKIFQHSAGQTHSFYITISHKNINKNYFNRFYTFESKPPFNILKGSKQFKISKNERIQFVSGMFIENNNVHISYGIDDSLNSIFIIPLPKVLEMLEDYF